MRPTNKAILRSATPFVTLAGTFCLVLPAYAGGHGGHDMRQLRLDNPAMSNRQIRQLARNDSASNLARGQASGLVSQFQTQQRPAHHALPLNDISNRVNRFNGQSAFVTDNGRVQAVAKGLELDLTSSDRSIVLGDKLFSSGGTHKITVGGEERTLTSGSTVSAAEYVALQQILTDGSQTLTVDRNGRGVSGQFSLNSISDDGRTIRAAELVIPQNVTASGDFSRHADGVRVTNDLVNYGSINAYSTNRNTDTARIAARDINNNAGATISTSSEALNLSLRADRDINNSGSISSSGNLELSAGRAINNNGSFSSNKDITLSGSPDADLLVNNSGGTFSALNGAINVRSSDYNGTGNTTVYGGDFFSREMNLFTGQGTTDVIVNQLTGVVNSSGSAAHVSTKTDTLVIGNQCLVGDPTYYNVGDIQIQGDIKVGETLAIIASGDITRTNSNTVILARDVSNKGCDINIIAGANVTAGSTTTGGPLLAQTAPTYTQNTTAPVSFTGASATGGNVDLAGTAFTIDSSSAAAGLSGGNITIAAYANSAQAKGLVNIPFGSLIITSGTTTGNNGGITIVGGGIGNTIQIGSQILANGGTGTTGDITIATAQPAFSSGSTMTFDTTGAITTGNRIVPAATINAGTIHHFSATFSHAGNISMHAGGLITLDAQTMSDAQSGSTNGGNISIISDNARVVCNSVISAAGGLSALGGTISIAGNENLVPLVLGGVFANGGTKGGSISIINNGTNGVQVGLLSAQSDGDGGQIVVTSNSFIDLTGSLFILDCDSSTAGANLTLVAGSQIRTSFSSALISAVGSSLNSINLSTLTGGITTDGNNLSILTDGTLALSLGNRTISADSATTTSGNLSLDAGLIAIQNSTSATPLVLTANGADTGNGGQITYIDHSTVQTFIGQPLKAPKGAANFLTLSAHAGPNNGNGGSVTADVAGNLTVNPNAIDVAFSPGAGAHNGGTINLHAGNLPSKKVGKLVILDDLNVEGTGGGASGNIALSAAATTNFVIGATKTPKNGILGGLEVSGGLLVVDSGGGLQVLNSLDAFRITLDAAGKGKISTADGVTLSAQRTTLNADSGSIDAQVNSGEFVIFTNSTATINSVNPGIIQLLSVDANKGFEINALERVNYSSISVANGGDVLIYTNGGNITGTSFASILVTDGDIVLHSDDIINGGIAFAFGGKAVTSGNKGGDVILAVGAIPKKPTNSVPDQFTVTNPDITVTNVGKGKTFFGVAPNSFLTQGSPLQVNAKNATVIMNNGAVDTSVNWFFAGNNLIEADPPSKPTGISLSMSGVPIVSALPADLNAAPNAITKISVIPTSTANQSFGIQTITTLPTDLVGTADGGARTNAKLESFGTIEPIAITSLYDDFNSKAPACDGRVEAYVWSDDDLGLNDAAMIDGGQPAVRELRPGSESRAATEQAATEQATLNKGAILFAPAKNTSVSTPFGQIEIARDSVAFVLVDDNKLSVFDLHDSRKGSVSISNGTNETVLSPGHCAVFTRLVRHEFEQLNPLRTVGYRSMSTRHHDGTKMFKAEFSTISAMNSIRPLHAVLNSKHENAKRISARLMKTTAVLMQLGANREEFRAYETPDITAMKN